MEFPVYYIAMHRIDLSTSNREYDDSKWNEDNIMKKYEVITDIWINRRCYATRYVYYPKWEIDWYIEWS